jgi:hypothetical protein
LLFLPIIFLKYPTILRFFEKILIHKIARTNQKYLMRIVQKFSHSIITLTSSGKLLVERQIGKRSSVFNRFKNLILPQNYPESVHQPFYWNHCKWTMLAGFVGSMVSVFSMQSMLNAMLLSRGYVIPEGSLPFAAATLNWIIKDGLGQLGGIVFVFLIGNRFDLHPKQLRFFSGIALNIAVLIELITPIFPKLFLLMAVIATTGKNVSWMASSASRAPLLKLLGKGDNLGDLTGKAASQLTITSMLGMGVGIGISEILAKHLKGIYFNILLSVPLMIVSTGMLYLSCRWAISNRLHPQRIFQLSQKLVSPQEMSAKEPLMTGINHLLNGIVLDTSLRNIPNFAQANFKIKDGYLLYQGDRIVYAWLKEGAGDEEALKAILGAINLREGGGIDAKSIKEAGWSSDGLSTLFKNRVKIDPTIT